MCARTTTLATLKSSGANVWLAIVVIIGKKTTREIVIRPLENASSVFSIRKEIIANIACQDGTETLLESDVNNAFAMN